MSPGFSGAVTVKDVWRSEGWKLFLVFTTSMGTNSLNWIDSVRLWESVKCIVTSRDCLALEIPPAAASITLISMTVL